MFGKRILKSVFILLISSVSASHGEEAAPRPTPSAEAIVKAADKRIYAMKDQTAQVTFRVVDTDGVEKKTIFRLYWKNYFGQDHINSKTLLTTESPENDRGIKFLVWENVDEAQADRWLYLPELRQVRRIQPGLHRHEKEPDSDLLFEDMRRRRVDEDEHQLLGEEAIRGDLCYVIENRPKGKGLYGKTIIYISKNDGTVRKIDYFSETGARLKVQWIDWRQIDRYFVWKASQIFNTQASRKTFIEVDDVKLDIGLPDDQFSERALRK